MIDLDQAIQLKEVCRIRPGLNRATVHRWVQRGVIVPDGRRVRLEAVRVGGIWMTDRAAVNRVVAECTGSVSDKPAGENPPARTVSQRERAAGKAETELISLGI